MTTIGIDREISIRDTLPSLPAGCARSRVNPHVYVHREERERKKGEKERKRGTGNGLLP